MGTGVADTNQVITAVKRKEQIDYNISSITLIEFPDILQYAQFHGEVLFAFPDDYRIGGEIQKQLKANGTPLSTADLIIAVICFREGITFYTEDRRLHVLTDVLPDLDLQIMEL